jgi:RNA polymerase sigma factor (sigma-70 family)
MEASFQTLIERIRARDSEAIGEFVRRYEPHIRRYARVRARDPQLRRLLDSEDICQQVLISLCRRLVEGQYRLDSHEQLLGLLRDMAHNKYVNEARRHRRLIRNIEQAKGGPPEELDLATPTPGPLDQLIARDLLNEVLRRLTPERRRVVDLREQGRDWPEVAAELGGTAESQRKSHERAVKWIKRQLRIDGGVP